MKRTRRGTQPATTPEALEELQVDAATLLERAATGAGAHRPATTSVRPEPLIGGFGSLAFSVPPVDISVGDEPWDGALVIRLEPPGGPVGDGRTIDEEAAWYRYASAHGFASPPILAVHPATDDDWGALVLSLPREPACIDRLSDPTKAIDVLTTLGRIHARIHQLPVDRAPGPVGNPIEALETLAFEIERAGDRPDDDPAFAWLATHVTPTARPSVSHGEVHPASVRLPAHEVDGDAPIITNWTSATLADPEVDLGRTLVTLWSSPYLATSRLDRSLMMMIRDGMLETYKNGYTSVAPVDEGRLVYWQTYHARYYAARARSKSVPDPWDPLAVVPHLTPLRRGLLERAAELTHDFTP